MYQEPAKRLPNRFESFQVRKVSSLLARPLRYGHVSDREFATVLNKFLTLRTYAAESEPRGQGMAGVNVRAMTQEVEKAE